MTISSKRMDRFRSFFFLWAGYEAFESVDAMNRKTFLELMMQS